MGKVKAKGCSPDYPLEDRELGFCRDTGQLLIGTPGGNIPVGGGGGGGVDFTTDKTLTLSPEGVLSVNTADVVEADNTLPVTSAAVQVTVGNIEELLKTI